MNPIVLTDEQKAIKAAVRRIATEKFAPKAAHWDSTYTPPLENLKVLAESGFTGICFPEEYGGSALGVFENVLIFEEISRACANTAMLLNVTEGASARLIMGLGTEEQRRRYLPKMAKAELLAAWSMSEPNAGSDLGSTQTKAVLKGDQYVVTGSKLWCTAAQVADLFIVFVRIGDAPGIKGVGALLIDKGTAGMTIGKHLDLIGLRGTGMAEILFEDAHVPAENLILAPGRMRDLFTLMASDRIAGNPPIALGVAQAAFTAAVQHVKDRSQFGKPLIENQGLQWKLADMATDIETARALIYNAAVRTDLNGQVPIYETSMAKVVANEMAVRVTNAAIQLAGSFGLSNEYPFERYFRDARGLSIGYGTTEIHRNSIARDIATGAYTC